ncbi:MAG: hypothetical protein E5V57_14990, partial [Mesorhizobium sp.]
MPHIDPLCFIALRNSAQQLRKPEHFPTQARTIIAHGQRRAGRPHPPPRRGRPGADREDSTMKFMLTDRALHPQAEPVADGFKKGGMNRR